MIGQNNITTQGIKSILGAQTNDVGALCLDSDINMYSYDKPHNSSNRCGLLYDSANKRIIYDRPTVFKLGDFRGYNHGDRGTLPDTTSIPIDYYSSEDITQVILRPTIGDSRFNYPQIFNVAENNLAVKVYINNQRRQRIGEILIPYKDVKAGYTSQMVHNMKSILETDKKIVFECFWWNTATNSELCRFNTRYTYFYKDIKYIKPNVYTIGTTTAELSGYTLSATIIEGLKIRVSVTNNNMTAFKGTTELMYRFRSPNVPGEWFRYNLFNDFNSLYFGTKSIEVILSNPPYEDGITDWFVDFFLRMYKK